MYKHTPAVLEAGQAAQQTGYKRGGQEVEHTGAAAWVHPQGCCGERAGGGKEENSIEQWSKIGCEHAVLM